MRYATDYRKLESRIEIHNTHSACSLPLSFIFFRRASHKVRINETFSSHVLPWLAARKYPSHLILPITPPIPPGGVHSRSSFSVSILSFWIRFVDVHLFGKYWILIGFICLHHRLRCGPYLAMKCICICTYVDTVNHEHTYYSTVDIR